MTNKARTGGMNRLRIQAYQVNDACDLKQTLDSQGFLRY